MWQLFFPFDIYILCLLTLHIVVLVEYRIYHGKHKKIMNEWIACVYLRRNNSTTQTHPPSNQPNGNTVSFLCYPPAPSTANTHTRTHTHATGYLGLQSMVLIKKIAPMLVL